MGFQHIKQSGRNNHRFKHGECNTKFYIIWKCMKERCNVPSQQSYPNYGGKGITYKEKWKNYLSFKEDMYFKYIYAKKKYKTKRLSIERLNNEKNYYFHNCIFIPITHQSKNRRNNKWFKAVSPNGKIYKVNNQREFARNHNLSQGCIHLCLKGYQRKTKNWTFQYEN
jgi:hypothetical protein